ncbi:MAG TPA: hypothetical protein VNI52_14460 [Sphingobacteriaceae bacterium]|nr:hypothetical protein [Sphingobacteriaceae bacterium]
MNNKSKKTEKLEPQDSKGKDINHPENDSEAVIKPEDKIYTKEEANFKNIAQRKENQEQPVYPIKTPPKDV